MKSVADEGLESSTHRLVGAEVVERVGEAERRLFHVVVHPLAEVLEADRRGGHNAQVGAEGALCHGVRLVPQKSFEVLLRIGRVVLLRVHPHHPVLACTTRALPLPHGAKSLRSIESKLYGTQMFITVFTKARH